VITAYLDDITIGDTHVSRARTITETDLVTFAMFTGDWHPIHTDVEYASADPIFGQRIAHGALVISVALGLVTFWPPAMKAFYGIDKLRFVKPVFIGDTIHVRKKVADAIAKGGEVGVVTFETSVLNQHGETVLVYRDKLVVKKRPA
jgi:acyl dehydratase